MASSLRRLPTVLSIFLQREVLLVQLVKPFGPEIGVSDLHPDVNADLLSICLALEEDQSRRMNDRLVGFIEKEYDITEELSNSPVMMYIEQAALSFINNAKSIYPVTFSRYDIRCTAAWCNIQQVGEYNPIHNHPSDDIVCVLFPLVDIVTDAKYNRNVRDELPGSLIFHSPSNDPRFGTSSYTVLPETGQVYVFSGALQHYTSPIYGEDDTRISVSCNFKIVRK